MTEYQVIETLSFVGRAMPKETFLKDTKDVMQALIAFMDSNAGAKIGNKPRIYFLVVRNKLSALSGTSLWAKSEP